MRPSLARLLGLFLALSLLLPSLPTTAQTAAPEFEPTDCAFEIPDGQTVECGYVAVPENRSDPNSRKIKLHVGIFRSTNPNVAPDPIVYLEGGPGGSALKNVELTFGIYFAPLLANHDLILMDQRGTGYSKPALDCEEFTEVTFDQLDKQLSPEDMVAQQMEALDACRTRLAKTVDLSAYNSRENAADFNDLRLALGYEQWNLWGISYGTRLGLTLMRDFPEGIRSVVLDSAYPLQEDLYSSVLPNFDRALRVLFDGCAANAACSSAYPDLEAVFYQTIDQLNAEPIVAQGSLPFSGTKVDLLITGDTLTGLIFQLLYATNAIPALPQIIYSAHNGDVSLLTALYSSILENVDLVSVGMQLAVQCSEEIPFGDPTFISTQEDAYPQLERPFRSSLNLSGAMFDTCTLWNPATPDALENEAVISDIPTLILSGEYDPITPPAWGQVVSQNLPNSTFLQFSGTGHGVSVTGECPTLLMNTFFDDPTAALPIECVATVGEPDFSVNTGEVVLEPFSDPTFGISGVKPQGWGEIAPGTFGRSALGDTALVEIAVPAMSAESTLELITSQLGMDSPPESIGERSANGLTWSLYQIEVQGLILHMATAEQSGTTYMVMLQTLGGDSETLYNSVFLPVIDAFTPN